MSYILDVTVIFNHRLDNLVTICYSCFNLSVIGGFMKRIRFLSYIILIATLTACNSGGGGGGSTSTTDTTDTTDTTTGDNNPVTLTWDNGDFDNTIWN